MQKVVILVLLLVAVLAKHDCQHDKIEKAPLNIAETPKDALDDDGGRRLTTYSSIRITADYTYLTQGSTVVREYLQYQVMPSAIKYYQSVLSVIPYSTSLSDNHACNGLAAPSGLVSGYANTDLVVLVTAGYTSSSESYLAYAVPCTLDGTTHRPIVGMINFNLNQVLTATNIDLEETFITTLHEMVHLLGFSSSLYSYWINPSTNAYINPLASTTVNGQTVYYLAADPVRQKVRDYFGCSDLEGPYLENQGDTGSAKSHFEREVFGNEIMTASAISDAVITQFTLAILESTGWYQVNYVNTAERFTYGQSKGCSFLRSSCMSGTSAAFTPEFCSPLQAQGCTFTGRNIGVCGTTTASTAGSGIPSSYNYWANNTAVLDPFSNNCPYMLGYPNLDCMEPTDASNAILSEEKYGLTSRCFSGTLSDTNSPNSKSGFCFPITCTQSGSSYTLTVTVGTRTVTCSSAGSINIAGLTGTLDCPDPTSYCAKANPVYCKRGCSGRGTCTNNQCVCPIGWGGMDCGLRYYVDGCSRCTGNSAGTSCFGDSCSCNPSTATCSGDALIGQGVGTVSQPDTSNAKQLSLSIAAFVLLVSILFF